MPAFCLHIMDVRFSSDIAFVMTGNSFIIAVTPVILVIYFILLLFVLNAVKLIIFTDLFKKFLIVNIPKQMIHLIY